MKLNAIEFPESMFTKGENFRCVGEASDMMNRHLQRLFDDAVDVGFKVRPDNGEFVITYALSATRKDADNDVTAWEYTGSDGSKALVFNE
jgi:hypothetical protein